MIYIIFYRFLNTKIWEVSTKYQNHQKEGKTSSPYLVGWLGTLVFCTSTYYIIKEMKSQWSIYIIYKYILKYKFITYQSQDHNLKENFYDFVWQNYINITCN